MDWTTDHDEGSVAEAHRPLHVRRLENDGGWLGQKVCAGEKLNAASRWAGVKEQVCVDRHVWNRLVCGARGRKEKTTRGQEQLSPWQCLRWDGGTVSKDRIRCVVLQMSISFNLHGDMLGSMHCSVKLFINHLILWRWCISMSRFMLYAVLLTTFLCILEMAVQIYNDVLGGFSEHYRCMWKIPSNVSMYVTVQCMTALTFPWLIISQDPSAIIRLDQWVCECALTMCLTLHIWTTYIWWNVKGLWCHGVSLAFGLMYCCHSY